MKQLVWFAAVGAVCAGAGSARADGGARPFVMPDLTHPSFRVDILVGGFDVGISPLLPPIEFSIATTEMTGTIPLGRSAFLGILIPVGRVESGDRSETGLGNVEVEVSGFSVRPQPNGGTVTFAAGLALTAPTGGPDLMLASMLHFGVAGRYGEHYFGFRPHLDLRYDRSRFFVQGQVGTAFYFATRDTSDSDDIKLAQLGIAGGVEVIPQLAAVAELTTIRELSDSDSDREFFHALDVGARYDRGHLSVGARFTTMLDEAMRDAGLYGVGIDVGGRF